jgi:hypothetical protein
LFDGTDIESELQRIEKTAGSIEQEPDNGTVFRLQSVDCFSLSTGNLIATPGANISLKTLADYSRCDPYLLLDRRTDQHPARGLQNISTLRSGCGIVTGQPLQYGCHIALFFRDNPACVVNSSGRATIPVRINPDCAAAAQYMSIPVWTGWLIRFRCLPVRTFNSWTQRNCNQMDVMPGTRQTPRTLPLDPPGGFRLRQRRDAFFPNLLTIRKQNNF